MNRTIIRAVKAGFHFFGMELHWVRKGVGVDAFRDMRYLSAVPDPVIFDVGANIGQSVERFRKYFPRPVIHSFEPGGAAFEELTRATAGVPDMRLNNFGLASQAGSQTFIENDRTDMSSLLEPGSDCWGEITRTYSVDVSTVDEYCAKTGIERIDILKIDTQGSELDVIKGAQAMMRKGAIHLIYLEIIFSEMYKGLPRLDEVYGFLADRGYTLVAFYDFWYQRERAAWTDALFIHSAYVR
jgi:FkbM family methyltransferase